LNTELLEQIKITKIVIEKFDQDSMWKALHNAQVQAHIDISPVKIFVNCKNSKRKAISAEVEKFKLSESMLGESLMLDESVMREDQRETLKQLWQPTITKEEIFFTSKENIEGFVCLLSHFLPQMASSLIDHPCLINVDNQCETSREGEQGQLFFNSLVEFKDTFTK